MPFARIITAIDARTGFDRWGPDANPLIRQARRRTGRLSLRATLWLAFILGIAGLLAAVALLSSGTAGSLVPEEWILSVFGWLLTLTSPVITASMSFWLTHRLVHAESYELTYLTPLPNETLVRAHLFMALYRARYVLGALVALMPFLVIEFFRFLVVFQAEMHTYTPAPPTYWEGVGPTLVVLLITLGLWGFNVLGAAFGVRAALLRRSSSIGATIALAQMSLAAFGPCACCWFGTPTLMPDVGHNLALIILVLMLVAWAALPYALAWLAVQDTILKWRR